ncbi:DnaJ domain-containing protein, putative [Eimeria tenella]|uniref:DnaJ domain-containing protein, putative n=1 Tax=Eimeria tenella TaxID=5802 RepID=U6KVG3_EIMTE|nr:DnaJ domain-containing protein, putative [Eimeria tenella]CDJ39485.1 DnaJ domain-containing protein, putative [Eimeria tenella]|eukprot:XP_013230240.1 DnaJ domain-containing protein, putative [Eimeria tenella]
MEGNKDEAARCVELAKQAMLAGDFAKAQRLLGKARRMFPLAEIEPLAAACLHKLNPSAAAAAAGTAAPTAASSRGASEPAAAASSSSNSSSSNSSSKGQRRGSRQHVPHSSEGPQRSTAAAAAAGAAGTGPTLRRGRSGAAAAPAAAAAAAHTPEQAKLCEIILEEKCFYKVLGVPSDASEEAIKKAYRKLALMLHPDKNKAPKAEDAFKKVSRVSAALLDPQQRRAYDLGGPQAVDGAPQQYPQRGGGAPDIVTAEDLFRVLFGQSVRDFQRSPNGRGRRGPQYPESNLHTFIQFLPMLLLFLLMFLFNFVPQEGSSPPAYYSFRQSKDFPVPRTTQLHSVRYYVGDSFIQEILPQPDKVRELERKVEVRHYQGVCTSENDRLNRDLTTAHYHMASNESIRRLLDRPRPGCKKLELLQRAGAAGAPDSQGP